MYIRKTIAVADLRASINARIASASDPEARKALCFLLSDLLMDANAYRGFRYLDGWKGVEDYRHEYY